MTRVFDGMAGVINRTLGGSVTVDPAGTATQIQAMFRRESVVVLNDYDDGGVQDYVPRLHVQIADLGFLSRGTIIDPGDGHTYVVLKNEHHPSPASDRFVVFDLQINS